MATILSDLKVGQKAIIRKFKNKETFLKLLEMGCVPGENLIVEQIAPFGDPISIKISGYHLSLRITEADDIEVDLID